MRQRPSLDPGDGGARTSWTERRGAESLGLRTYRTLLTLPCPRDRPPSIESSTKYRGLILWDFIFLHAHVMCNLY